MLCDVVVLYVVKRKSYYRTKKYQYVNDPEDEVNDQVIEIGEIIKGWKITKRYLWVILQASNVYWRNMGIFTALQQLNELRRKFKIYSGLKGKHLFITTIVLLWGQLESWLSS